MSWLEEKVREERGERREERGERRVSMHHHSSVHARQMRCRQAHVYTCTMLQRKLPLLATKP